MYTQIFAQFLIQNPLLVVLLISHFLADFHWQSQKMADQKEAQLTALVRHLAIVGCSLIPILIWQPASWLLLVTVLLGHVLIDGIKFHMAATFRTRGIHKELFILDQLLHLGLIFLAYQVYDKSFMNPFDPLNETLLRIFFFLLITKPVNITFKLFFEKYQVRPKLEKEQDQVVDDSILGAGALIGNLERLIMGILLLFGQFAAIGLVFTAKSIARYNKISESQSFAEYYLIGSLYSMISVFVAYFICFW